MRLSQKEQSYRVGDSVDSDKDISGEKGRSWYFFSVSNATVYSNFISFIIVLQCHGFPINCQMKGKLFSQVPPHLAPACSLVLYFSLHSRPCSHLAKRVGAEPLSSVSSSCTCSPLFLQSPSPAATWQRETYLASPGSSASLAFMPPLHLVSPLPPFFSWWFTIISYVCPPF